jgi:retron-type reverse transcriptase
LLTLGLLRIIQRFLKAGVMEDGMVSVSEEGTPQGGLVSPVLSNIYLHYVLDLWLEKRFVKSCRGKAQLVRFADDYVACFQYEEDAKRFRNEMAERLAAFDLEVEPSKTAVLRFGSKAKEECHKDGVRRALEPPAAAGIHVGRGRLDHRRCALELSP